MNPDKQIVFCHICNNIVGDSFPVIHGHKNWGNGSGAIWLMEHNMTGFTIHQDTEENRKCLAENFPPRTKLEIGI